MGWMDNPDDERVFLPYILILSSQEFKELWHKIENEDSFSSEQRRALIRTIVAPAQKRLLRDKGRIIIDAIFRRDSEVLNNVWFIRCENKMKIVARPLKPLILNCDEIVDKI
jgi:DNA-binding transcriptional regulator/RsmH inhibitor MraZ